ncbi:MAG: glycoside hydrolase family 3 protein, partial [Bacteroidales bacterium]|nr:glycoside hydrolase family 3 protein [Candidatus Cacconaster merdequi]
MQRNLTARLFTKIAAIAIIVAVAVSCDKDPVPGQNQENKPTPSQKETFAIKPVEQMSLTEKIGQMFFLRVETLAGSTTPAKSITQAMAEEFAKFPCGGFTLFADNIATPAQLYEIVHNCHKLGNYPLISIDEEGGRVARIGKNKNFDVPHFESMLSVGNTGNEANAFDAGKSIGNYLASCDIDIDLAPVADVFTNPANTVIGDRAFSTDPVIAGNMSSQFLLGLKSKHVEGCLKHFPGHGDTST